VGGSKHTNPLKGKLSATKHVTVPFSSSVSSHQILLRFSCTHTSVLEETCSSYNSILPYYTGDAAFIWNFLKRGHHSASVLRSNFSSDLQRNAAARQGEDEIARVIRPLFATSRGLTGNAKLRLELKENEIVLYFSQRFKTRCNA